MTGSHLNSHLESPAAVAGEVGSAVVFSSALVMGMTTSPPSADFEGRSDELPGSSSFGELPRTPLLRAATQTTSPTSMPQYPSGCIERLGFRIKNSSCVREYLVQVSWQVSPGMTVWLSPQLPLLAAVVVLVPVVLVLEEEEGSATLLLPSVLAGAGVGI